MWASALKMKLEGIVSKRLDAPYVSGPHGGWTKAKSRPGQEVVLGGWTSERGELRSLLAGVYRDGLLEYVGRIGTGYGEAVARKVLPVLEKHTTDVSPFSGKDAPRKEANIRWLEAGARRGDRVRRLVGGSDDPPGGVQRPAPGQGGDGSGGRTADAGGAFV